MFMQMAARRRRMGGFSPLGLFRSSEPGVWLDPSDLTTLFQDTAGTTPVTAAGQSVGLVLDKSGRGNHATQSIFASRPIYGVEPSTGRRNLLTRTEQFDNAAWVNAAATVNVTANAVTAPDGTLTGDKLVPAAATGFQVKRQIISVVAGAMTFSVYAKEGDTGVRLEMFVGNTATAGAVFNLATGAAVVTAAGTTTDVGAADANGWRRYSISFTGITAAGGIFDVRVTESSSRDQQMTGDGVKGIFVWGAQLEIGSTATAYQRVVSQYDVSEAGLPSVAYLFDDLIDDSLNWTAPAGSYTVAWCDTAGNVTIQTAQALSGATDALRTQQMVGYLAINRALTAAETANLTAWLQRKAGG